MIHPKTKRDPDGTRRRILEAAVEEFAGGGLSGARVDQIARRAETNERMLYYYFGSKELLFVAALEEAYRHFADAARSLDLSGHEPSEAIVRLAHFIWDYYRNNQALLQLVNSENLHSARYMRQSSQIASMIAPQVDRLGEILARGAQTGVFRNDVDPLRFYVTMTGLGYYVVSSRHTLQAIFDRDFDVGGDCEGIVRLHTDMLLGYLRPVAVA
jgi:AcrR family transcriptional regulator